MNPIALQSALLAGDTFGARIAAAKAAGADGVEFFADAAFFGALPEIIDALDRSEMRASAVRIGHTRLVHPDYAEREKALVVMQDALTAAVDIGAQGVVFYPHYAPHSVLPDLEPYKAAVELEAELLITLLRKTICDLANALGMQLFLAHADSSTSALLRRPEHAAMIRAKLDNHPRMQVALTLGHLDAEHIDAASALSTDGLGYICACDTGGTLPGRGGRDWTAWASALHSTSYSGWVTLDGGAPQPVESLRDAISVLRGAGL